MALKTFAQRVRHLRKLWGLTQTEIHQAGGPSRTTLYRIERGETSTKELSEASLDGLAEALKCQRFWLETGAGVVFPRGVVVPEGTVDGISNHDLQHEGPPITNPESGRYITDGPTDWAIVVAAVQAVDESIGEWNGWNDPAIGVYQAEAYRLVYKYLLKQKDPFHPIPSKVLSTILGVV